MLNVGLVLKLFSFPLIIYTLFFFIRLNGGQPATEGQMGDLITACDFLFGAFVAYFIFVLISRSQEEGGLRWWGMSGLLLLLAIDEVFMVHEYLGAYLGIKDRFILLFYGGLLGLLLLCDLKAIFQRDTFFYLLLFSAFSVLALVSDYLFNEGVMVVMGRDISYEQFSETFGAMFLSCAVVTMAMHFSIRALWLRYNIVR